MIIVTCFQYDFQTANENNSLVCLLNKGWLTILELIGLAMAEVFFALSLECLNLRGCKYTHRREQNLGLR